MSYIGSTPTTQSFIAGTDYFNGTGSAVNFTLSRSVNSVNDIEVIVNNVEQIPSGYSVSGTTLTFSAAPSAGTSNVYVRYLSTTLQSTAPQPGSVNKRALDVGSGGVGTGAAQMPGGTTAERPGTPLAGMYRLNTTTGEPEWYDALVPNWKPFSVGANYTAEYLVVAGGGAGNTGFINDNNARGGGGGAGGMLFGSTSLASGNVYTVVVGAGGAYVIQDTAPAGAASSFGSLVTTVGGGGGARQSRSGGSGGSGGGCAYNGTTDFGLGTAGQGNNGGPGNGTSAGGGGGRGGTGGTPTGGAGASNSISGAAVTYAAGGSGGSGSSGAGVAGAANTGNGGGGGGDNAAAGSNGGSGIVVVRYLGVQRAAGGTVTSAGGYTIHTFTSSGTYTA